MILYIGQYVIEIQTLHQYQRTQVAVGSRVHDDGYQGDETTPTQYAAVTRPHPRPMKPYKSVADQSHTHAAVERGEEDLTDYV